MAIPKLVFTTDPKDKVWQSITHFHCILRILQLAHLPGTLISEGSCQDALGVLSLQQWCRGINSIMYIARWKKHYQGREHIPGKLFDEWRKDVEYLSPARTIAGTDAEMFAATSGNYVDQIR